MLVSPVCTGECQNTIFLASGAGIDSALPQIDRHRAWDSLGRGSKARTPRAGARQVGNTPRAAHLCQWWGHDVSGGCVRCGTSESPAESQRRARLGERGFLR